MLVLQNYIEGRYLSITASIYVTSQGRLVCGRDDGSIVIIPAITALKILLLNVDQPRGE